MTDLEEKVRAVLDEFEDEIENDEGPVRPGLWIFRRAPDRERFVRAILGHLHEAEEAARLEGARAVGDVLSEECACRCRAHGRPNCPKCLDVARCPAHAQDDPGRISPRWRREYGE